MLGNGKEFGKNVAAVVSTVKDHYGFIEKVEGIDDLYFKQDKVTHNAGLKIQPKDKVRCWTKTNREGKVYLHQVELTNFAPKTSRQMEALKVMDDWRRSLKAAQPNDTPKAALEAGSCLAVWRAVCDLVGKAMDPQWSALAEGEPATDGPVTGSTGSTGSDTRMRGIRRRNHFKKVAEDMLHEGEHLRAEAEFQRKKMRVDEVFFTHGEVSAQFRNGGTLTQLLGDLRRGRVLPTMDDRLRLDVFKLNGKVRSVNNRRLWVLKQFQAELKKTSDLVEVAVNLHPLCKGTAKFIMELCEDLMTAESMEVRSHPDVLAARQTLQYIQDAPEEYGVVVNWAFDKVAKERRAWLDDLTFVGQPPQATRKRRREEQEADPGFPAPTSTEMDHNLAKCIQQGQWHVEVVEFNSKSYIRERGVGQALFALKEEQGKSFYVNARVIPLCPMTAKVVLANSTHNDGKSVKIRGTMEDHDEWPLDRIVALILEVLSYLHRSTSRSPQIFSILGSSRLLGERSAVISAIRKKKRFSQEVLSRSWPFLQQLMIHAASKFNGALPICRYLCADSNVRGADSCPPLLNLLSMASQKLAANDTNSQDLAWYAMPLIPSPGELRSLKILTSGKQRSALQQLPVVRQRGSYKSTGDYLDTYFRLLREDCISAIRQSIADVRDRGKNADKAKADGNVFNAKLKGVTVGKGSEGIDSRIKAVFEVQPMFPSKRWNFQARRYFMNGNLIACVCEKDFSSPIWLLASRRDLERKKEVALDFYIPKDGASEESMHLARLWGAKSLILIGSPTYFRSFEPILQTLKSAEVVGLPFTKELVECETVETCHLLSDQHVDRRLIFQNPPVKDATEPKFQVLGVSKDVAGMSWILSTSKTTEVNVDGCVLFDVTPTNSGSTFLCRNRCEHQIQLLHPMEEVNEEQTELVKGYGNSFLAANATVELDLHVELVTSTGAKECRFRFASMVGTLRQFVEEIAVAAKDLDGPWAKATTWDDSQLRAAQHALQCRVTLIQGPPGTGKTFIGCKLLQMFLPQSRVLVLTYKNHALDDFLQHCIQANHLKGIARIGSRSNDDSQELQSCFLRNLRKKATSRRDRDTKHVPDIDKLMSLQQTAKATVAAQQQKFLHCLEKFRDKGAHTLETFLSTLSGEQLAEMAVDFLEHHWRELKLVKSRQIRASLDRARQAFGEELHHLPSFLLGATNTADGDEEELKTLRKDLIDVYEMVLKHWYPEQSELQEAGDFFTDQPDAQDEDMAWTSVNDGIDIPVQSPEEAIKILRAVDSEGKLQQTIHLPHGVKVERGWALQGITDESGTHGTPIRELPSKYPATFTFKEDDEAEREMQAEIEAERLQGSGGDVREWLSKEEETALIRTRPIREHELQFPWVPYKFPPETQEVPLRHIFRLRGKDKAKLVVQQIMHQARKAFQELQAAVEDLAAGCNDEEALDVNLSAKILEDKKIIGMTVTGASINAPLLAQIKPDVVIVEEAAEVLEPQILAVLGPWVKQMILIGDHRQLPPPVETYLLKRDHLFDVSMLERLVGNHLPNVELLRQGRMLPSISKLLLPIYPDLRDNEKVVADLKKPDCVTCEVFFWNCPHEEVQMERSRTNEHEAERAFQLACFFIAQGIAPSEITILAAYQAQASVIKGKVKNYLAGFLQKQGVKRELKTVKAQIDPGLVKRGNVVDITDAARRQSRITLTGEQEVQIGRYVLKHQKNINEDGKIEGMLEPHSLQPDEMPEVSTIDRYQGAENQIVIVSLVRSNKDKKIGFLGTEDGKNRMTVAQSRAKRGLYLIGNVECLRGAPHWQAFIDMLQERDPIAVGDRFPQICPRHPEINNPAQEAENVGIVCKRICGKPFGCGKHQCSRMCHPDDATSHTAAKCPVLVEKSYEQCRDSPQHVFEVACGKDMNAECPWFEMILCHKQEHQVKRLCEVTPRVAKKSCIEPCAKFLQCGHRCRRLCKEECMVEADCQEPKYVTCQRTVSLPSSEQHYVKGHCGEKGEDIAGRCQKQCGRPLPCGHLCDITCQTCTSNHDATYRCEQLCRKVLPCGHLCGRPCWEACDDKNCVLCPAKPKPKPMPRPETKAMPVQKAPIVQPPIAAPALPPPPPPPPLAQPQPEPTPAEAEQTATLDSVDDLPAATGNVTLSEHQSTVNPPLPRHSGEDRGGGKGLGKDNREGTGREGGMGHGERGRDERRRYDSRDRDRTRRFHGKMSRAFGSERTTRFQRAIF